MIKGIPYFEKYGRSRLYHKESNNAEILAQSKDLLIWNTIENESGHTRGDYTELKNWWNTRAPNITIFHKLS